MSRFMDDFERDTDSFFKAARPSLGVRIAWAVWALFCLLVGLGILGVLGWAVIQLVTWVTAQ